MSAYTDYQSWFANTQPGTSQDWAGGSIYMGEGGQATYTDPTGVTSNFDINTPMLDLYQNPYISQQWSEQYPGTFNPQGDMFDFPLDIMPTTVSGSSSSSYSGLPTEYRDQLLSALMPQLISSMEGMEGNIDRYTGEALGSYQQMMQNAMRTNMPQAIDALTNRGILSSTMGENIMGNVQSAAAIDASNKGYQTAMQAALLKANMPSVLGQIGQLGSYTQSRGSTSSRTEDPTRMYAIMADLLRGMM